MISVEAMAVLYEFISSLIWSSMKWYEKRSPPTKILWIEKDAMLLGPTRWEQNTEGLWRPRGGIGAIGRGGGDAADTLHLGWIGDGLATDWRLSVLATPPKVNIAPEKWWLEDEFPFGIADF